MKFYFTWQKIHYILYLKFSEVFFSQVYLFLNVKSSMVFMLKTNEKEFFTRGSLKRDKYYWQFNGQRKVRRFHFRQQCTILFTRQSRKALDLNACEQSIFAWPIHLGDREDEHSRSSRVLRSRSAVGERSRPASFLVTIRRDLSHARGSLLAKIIFVTSAFIIKLQKFLRTIVWQTFTAITS